MTKTETNRLPKISALAAARERGERLANFLNTTKGDPKQQRVLDVIDCCRELAALRWASRPTVEYIESSAGIKHEVQKAKLTQRIDTILQQYRFVPAVSVDYRLVVSWRPSAAPELSEAEMKALRASPGDLSKFPIGETAAIQAVLEMAAQDMLDRIRECRCGNWFMATTNKKQVCSDACRFEKYRDDQEAQEKREAYDRKYNKNPKVKQRRSKQRKARRNKKGKP